MIFKDEDGRIEIKILRRSFPESNDYWDANWLEAEIRIEIPHFSACYGMNLQSYDLQKFYEELVSLEALITKKASFTTLEHGLNMECTANSRGHILCQVRARDDSNSILSFELHSDIPSMKTWISEVRSALKIYNVIGQKS